MNYHEALGRYTELKEQLAAEQVRRQALLHNLGAQASQAATTARGTDFGALAALLAGAQAAEEKIKAARAALAEVAVICNKPLLTEGV